MALISGAPEGLRRMEFGGDTWKRMAPGEGEGWRLGSWPLKGKSMVRQLLESRRVSAWRQS